MHPIIWAQVKRVRDATDLFECSGFRSSGWDAGADAPAAQASRLTVAVRVCGRTAFNCIVAFDAADVTFPPDLIVQGAGGFCPDLGSIKPLVEWRAQDDRSLLQALVAVRLMFIADQRRRMAECPVERIVFDVSCLSHVYDLELLVEMGDDDHKLVCHFYLPLAYEEFFSDTDDQEPAGKAILHVALTANAITNKIEATSRELLTPPRLLPDSTIRLPALGLDTLILDYVEQVQDVLARSRNARFNSLASREMLVKCFLTEFQQFIVEYDSVDFTYLSLFISIVSPVPNKSTPNVTAAALVNITIPKSFPDAPPAIMLVSPVVFKSPDSHVPESREWRVAFTRNTIIEDYVEFVKNNIVAQIAQFHGTVTPKLK